MKSTWQWLGLLFAFYAATSIVTYAFRHPEMTDTQRFLHTLDALLWR